MSQGKLTFLFVLNMLFYFGTYITIVVMTNNLLAALVAAVIVAVAQEVAEYKGKLMRG